MSVLPGSVYKYNTNRLPSAIREIPIPRSIQSPRKLGLCTDLGIGISRDSPRYPVGIIIRLYVFVSANGNEKIGVGEI